MDQRGPDFDPDRDDVLARASRELERAAEADDESRLRILEDLYRTLEAELEAPDTR